jgi:hypothetical protein
MPWGRPDLASQRGQGLMCAVDLWCYPANDGDGVLIELGSEPLLRSLVPRAGRSIVTGPTCRLLLELDSCLPSDYVPHGVRVRVMVVGAGHVPIRMMLGHIVTKIMGDNVADGVIAGKKLRCLISSSLPHSWEYPS